MSKNTVAQSHHAEVDEVRTSITLPRPLLNELKITAVQRNVTLQQLCNDAIRNYLRSLGNKSV